MFLKESRLERYKINIVKDYSDSQKYDRYLFLIENRKVFLNSSFRSLWESNFSSQPDFSLTGDFSNDFVLNCYYKILDEMVKNRKVDSLENAELSS